MNFASASARTGIHNFRSASNELPPLNLSLLLLVLTHIRQFTLWIWVRSHASSGCIRQFSLPSAISGPRGCSHPLSPTSASSASEVASSSPLHFGDLSPPRLLPSVLIHLVISTSEAAPNNTLTLRDLSRRGCF